MKPFKIPPDLGPIIRGCLPSIAAESIPKSICTNRPSLLNSHKVVYFWLTHINKSVALLAYNGYISPPKLTFRGGFRVMTRTTPLHPPSGRNLTGGTYLLGLIAVILLSSAACFADSNCAVADSTERETGAGLPRYSVQLDERPRRSDLRPVGRQSPRTIRCSVC